MKGINERKRDRMITKRAIANARAENTFDDLNPVLDKLPKKKKALKRIWKVVTKKK